MKGLRIHLWNVVLKCKSVKIFNFSERFLKMYMFEIAAAIFLA